MVFAQLPTVAKSASSHQDAVSTSPTVPFAPPVAVLTNDPALQQLFPHGVPPMLLAAILEGSAVPVEHFHGSSCAGVAGVAVQTEERSTYDSDGLDAWSEDCN